MKRFLFPVIFVLANLLCAGPAAASHIFGGELLYTNISGNSYTVRLTLYGDCGPTGASAFAYLPTATPLIHIYHGSHLDSFHIVLHAEPNTGIEVSPVCPAELHNTNCNGGTLPGVKKFVYSATTTLGSVQADWHFLFDGNLGDSSKAGRSANITNVYNAAVSNVYLEATLNNLAGPNSSPEYTTIPTPFYTLNVPQQYNQGAVDPDNDSLSFQLVDALDNGNSVFYYSNPDITLSGARPLLTDTGQFVFNPLNGQMSFKPNALQNALVVGQVTEYKNGIIVGTSKREMTFVVLNLDLDYVQNTNAVNISGGGSSGNNVINLCIGTPTVSFDINPVDTASNNISVSYTALPPGATMNLQNDNTTSPALHFSWNTTSVNPGVYNFFVSYRNNACPISTTQTIAYTLNVVNPFQLISITQGATQCYHPANITAIITQGVLPATISISKDGNPVYTGISASDTAGFALPAGNYTGMVSAPGLPGCSAPFSFTIVDSGTYPFTPEVSGDLAYCIHDPTTVLLADSLAGCTIQWYNAAGVSIPSAPLPSSDSAGVFTWYVSQRNGPCVSALEAVNVHVYGEPDISLNMEQGTVCVGEVIYLDAAGAKSYYWEPYNKIFTDKDGRQFIRVYEPSEYTLYVESEFGCKDSLKLRYTKVEPCCHFTYPNAFTPNGDGKNDRFHALVIGNMEYYELSIYDRWGKRVFWTKNKADSWDGNYNGRPASNGTYYYRVHAMCATGHEEDKSGPLELVR